MRGVSETYRGKYVRVFRLERERILGRLREGARRLRAERPETLQVILFGSMARGDARPGSDADVLIVVRESRERFLDRTTTFAPYFADAGIGCDLLVYTHDEVATLESHSIAKTALIAGVSLA